MALARREGRPERCSLRSAVAHELQGGVDPDPAKRLGLPAPRPVADPAKTGAVVFFARDERCKRAAGEVRHGDTVTDVAPRPADARRRVETDRRVPVPGDPERSAPPVGDPCLGQSREEVDERLADERVHPAVTVEARFDARAEVVGSAPCRRRRSGRRAVRCP